jgi:glycosyltransferase involved in cell wall biosynthesis
MANGLRVCIDARLEPGAAGGVVQFVLGLAHGLAQLEDGTEDYLFLVRPGRGEWLLPYLGERMTLLEAERRALPPPALAARVRGRLGRRAEPGDERLPPTKGAAEAAGADVMHFPTQQGFRTTIPSLYHPWDLQHLHFPDFFTPTEWSERDALYRALCRQARVVVTPTRAVAEDLTANFDVPMRKVAVVPPASPLAAYAEPTEGDLARIRAAYELPETFVFYPAQTWPHKNHLALVEALSLLAREGTRIPVVCAGWLNDFHPTIEERVREAGLSREIRFVGQLSGPEVAAVSRLATALVFPSLFEGFGLPVLEAFSTGLPVVCSDIPPFREITAGAAATFDPTRPAELALELRRVWLDEGLRRELADRGHAREHEFSWVKTARLLRAQYRRVAGTTTSDDHELLEQAAMEKVST